MLCKVTVVWPVFDVVEIFGEPFERFSRVYPTYKTLCFKYYAA